MGILQIVAAVGFIVLGLLVAAGIIYLLVRKQP